MDGPNVHGEEKKADAGGSKLRDSRNECSGKGRAIYHTGNRPLTDLGSFGRQAEAAGHRRECRAEDRTQTLPAVVMRPQMLRQRSGLQFKSESCAT